VPEVPDPVDAVFAIEGVHTLEITLGQVLYDTLEADPYTHVETDVVFDGQSLTSVGLRIKGRYGSYRSLSQKSGFKIDLNRFHEGQTLYGLKHLNVNNLVQDAAQLHDRVSYNAYRSQGVPAPRVGYAWVTVDGEPYGLYGLVEDYDEQFLEKNFAEPDGNLYDGDYWLAEDWSYYVLVDFEPSTYTYFDQDAGTDVGLADIKGVVDQVSATCGGQDFDEAMDTVIDYDHWLRFYALEMWVGQWDGYNFNDNNFRIYFDPGRDGRMIMMPWDHDQPFYDDLWFNQPEGLLSSCCKADFGCRERFYSALDDVCLGLDTEALAQDLRDTAALINPYVQEDPRREISYDTALYYQDLTEDWVYDRCDELGRWEGF
jgi:spore coat protein CotH